jgi:hypothetical protein
VYTFAISIITIALTAPPSLVSLAPRLISLRHIWILKQRLLVYPYSGSGIVSAFTVFTGPTSGSAMLTKEPRLYRILHAIISGRLLLKIRQAALSSGTPHSTTQVGTAPPTMRTGDVMEMKPLKPLQAQSHPAAESSECVKSPSELYSGLHPGLARVASFPF